MVKYRIQKTMSHKYLGNICNEIFRYKIQYKNFLFWKDYVYKTSRCNTSDSLEPVYEYSNVYFDTEEKAISALNKISYIIL